MKATFDHQIISSFILWLDNKICNDGSGFANTTSYFYPVNQPYTNYYYYASPYKGMVYDSGVTGATIMTGVYLDNDFITTGEKGLYQINYDQGAVIFTSGIAGAGRISGSFAVKEFNVKLTSEPEEFLLFETKHYLKPKITQTTTGLYFNETTYPVIYVRSTTSHNYPFAFGGQDETKINLRCTILADTQYDLDAVSSLLRDSVRTYIAQIAVSDFPSNVFGGYKGGIYNYDTISQDKVVNDSGIWIEKCDISKVGGRYIKDSTVLNTDVFAGFADITLNSVRFPRG